MVYIHAKQTTGTQTPAKSFIGRVGGVVGRSRVTGGHGPIIPMQTIDPLLSYFHPHSIRPCFHRNSAPFPFTFSSELNFWSPGWAWSYIRWVSWRRSAIPTYRLSIYVCFIWCLIFYGYSRSTGCIRGFFAKLIHLPYLLKYCYILLSDDILPFTIHVYNFLWTINIVSMRNHVCPMCPIIYLS